MAKRKTKIQNKTKVELRRSFWDWFTNQVFTSFISSIVGSVAELLWKAAWPVALFLIVVVLVASGKIEFLPQSLRWLTELVRSCWGS